MGSEDVLLFNTELILLIHEKRMLQVNKCIQEPTGMEFTGGWKEGHSGRSRARRPVQQGNRAKGEERVPTDVRGAHWPHAAFEEDNVSLVES